MRIDIPDYLLKRMARNYLLLATNGTFDNRNIKVANAVRLAKRDVATVERYITKTKVNGNQNSDKGRSF